MQPGPRRLAMGPPDTCPEGVCGVLSLVEGPTIGNANPAAPCGTCVAQFG